LFTWPTSKAEFADVRDTSAGARCAAPAAQLLDCRFSGRRTVKHTIDVPPVVWAQLSHREPTCYRAVARDGSLVPRVGDLVEFVDQAAWWRPDADTLDRLYFRVGQVTSFEIAGGPAVHWAASITSCNPLAA
jgi:hypothetical protein